MKNRKFIFNNDLLKYELYKLKLKDKILVFSIFIFLLFLYTMFSFLVFKQITNKENNSKLVLIDDKISHINEEITNIYGYINSIEKRDRVIYFEMLGIRKDSIKTFDTEYSDKSIDYIIESYSRRIRKMKRGLYNIVKDQDLIINEINKKSFRLNSIPSINPIKDFVYSLESLSGFGYRIHPVFKKKMMHTGIDLSCKRGTPIYATGNGRVVLIKHMKTGYGKHLIIDHGYGYMTLYGHMSKIKSNINDEVKIGEIIGYVGSTGTSTAPHLHYEVIYNNKKVNPIPFMLNKTNFDNYSELDKYSKYKNQSK